MIPNIFCSLRSAEDLSLHLYSTIVAEVGLKLSLL